jgi:hypothetical protein
MPRAVLASACGMLLLLTLVLHGEPAPKPAAEVVQFNRDIRPILADHCYQCHGPDQARRKADLRFDTEEGARRVIVAGELVRRITATDVDERMPPASKGRPLSPRQIDLLKRWVVEGAKWQQHWAFIPPSSPVPPAKASARDPIDAFILDRLAHEALSSSPEADRTTLIRRVTLDLTGLPPTPQEVDVFLADDAPDAYEKVVDRLLASPRLGERLAFRWLDAARYADTNGYQSDGERFMWRWRDWVIEAFNSNKPFDQFTIEQLAGDLLPRPSMEQRIATGFNRNHRGNGEGGVIPEEYAVEYVVDRVETTATVWMGLTLGCARCHSHKYDPFTQKEFYQLFAFFNNVPERGRANKYGNSPPMISAPTRDQEARLSGLIRREGEAFRAFASRSAELTSAQTAWEKTVSAAPPMDWSWSRDLLAAFPFEPDREPKAAAYGAGPVGKAGVFDGQHVVEAGDVGDFGFYDKFSIGAWVFAKGDHGGTIVSRMVDKPEADGYALVLRDGRLQFNLVKRWLDDALRVETKECIEPERWQHVLMTYDGSRVADGVRLYVDGRPVEIKVLLDELNQPFQVKEPLRIGGGGGPESRFQGLIDEVRLYRGVLRPTEAALLATPESINCIAAMPPSKRSFGQAYKLQVCFLEEHAPLFLRDAYAQMIASRRDREAFADQIPTTMIMQEMEKRRDAFVLIRGQYDKPGEKVTRGVPSVLPRLESPRSPTSPSRLDLARWLVQPDHPLTARVTVNRYWQMLFGIGLVKTTEDFGTQGEWPSHPELLDWLASDFAASGWDVKRLLRLIVTSATYRQSSRLTPELLQKDPDNRLLARGPRVRLPAETVRDQALAASGLLVERLGGPSVKPYQPAGLWKELTGTEEYVPDQGDKLYRRSLYTFWKRTVAPPQMLTFDAAGREMCVVRETRTNTPLQALNLMNDVTFVEAARVLAQRVLREAGPTDEDRIVLAFRYATGRRPRAEELQILRANLQHHRLRYKRDPQAAAKLVAAGQYPRDPCLEVGELAAHTAVASLILNLDEVITKE